MNFTPSDLSFNHHPNVNPSAIIQSHSASTACDLLSLRSVERVNKTNEPSSSDYTHEQETFQTTFRRRMENVAQYESEVALIEEQINAVLLNEICPCPEIINTPSLSELQTMLSASKEKLSKAQSESNVALHKRLKQLRKKRGLQNTPLAGFLKIRTSADNTIVNNSISADIDALVQKIRDIDKHQNPTLMEVIRAELQMDVESLFDSEGCDSLDNHENKIDSFIQILSQKTIEELDLLAKIECPEWKALIGDTKQLKQFQKLSTDALSRALFNEAAKGNGDTNRMRLFILAGADVDALNYGNDSFKKTALHCAAIWSNIEQTRLLLRMGATHDILDDDQAPAVAISLRLGPTEKSLIISRLLLAAASGDQMELLLDAPNPSGNTLLYESIRMRTLLVAQSLLALGARPDILNHDGDTAAHLAAQIKEHPQLLAEILSAAPSLFHAKNKKGQTPMDIWRHKA